MMHQHGKKQMSAIDYAWSVLKAPPLPRGSPISGAIGDRSFGPAGPKKLSNQMARALNEMGGEMDQGALKQFLMEHGDNPEVMDMLSSRFGMEPGSINFPGSMMPHDPHSTMVMPDLPAGAPEMSMMQPDGARTPAPQIAGGGLSGGKANEIAQLAHTPMTAAEGANTPPRQFQAPPADLSQFSTAELQAELFRRIQAAGY